MRPGGRPHVATALPGDKRFALQAAREPSPDKSSEEEPQAHAPPAGQHRHVEQAPDRGNGGGGRDNDGNPAHTRSCPAETSDVHDVSRS